MKEVSCNLGNCFLCQFCIAGWKEIIAIKKKTIFFKRGELIFKEGQKVTGIYFIYSGAVKVHKQWTDRKELIIRFATSGDILGHRGLGAGDVYPVSATALEDTKACFIDNDFLDATLQTNHAFTYRLMQIYAVELQKAELRMRNLAHMEVKGRIATTLLEITDLFGTGKDKYISVVITRQDIAAHSGTAYETVFKFFKTLIKNKTIGVAGKKIRIINRNVLQGMIGNN